jgi:hypothetical protein
VDSTHGFGFSNRYGLLPTPLHETYGAILKNVHPSG